MNSRWVTYPGVQSEPRTSVGWPGAVLTASTWVEEHRIPHSRRFWNRSDDEGNDNASGHAMSAGGWWLVVGDGGWRWQLPE
jgi:hypothetical protein